MNEGAGPRGAEQAPGERPRDPLSRCQQETSLKYRVESRKCVRSVHRIHIHFRCGIMFKVFTEKEAEVPKGLSLLPATHT